MQVRAILKSITQLAGGEATATVQLTGLANLETFHDGYAVSHAIPRSLLAPGADIVVEIVDPNHPGDGQVISVASVSAGAGGAPKEQFGSVAVSTDGSGNGSQAIVFPNTFSSFGAAPTVTLSAPAGQLGSGTLTASAITTSGFTAGISSAAVTGGAVSVSWDAQGT
ncbi:MAG TPA: hypothetical protein VG815_19020 [Chloroflexota bacterium]|jgi:hypothetical protein|nr:hypothetical protein [Chloroflexota bacterium]